MLSVKISTKNQIAVPSEARRKLGLKAGDRLDVDIEGDVIHLRRHVPAGDRLYGIGAHLAMAQIRRSGSGRARRMGSCRWRRGQVARECGEHGPSLGAVGEEQR